MHSLGVVVGDIDQAYEQCSRERAWAGWLRLRDLWGDKPLAIDKFDRKHAVTGNDFSKRCHSLPLDMMQQSVFAFLAARYIVEVGDKAYELGGLPMGLVLSGTALSLNMVMVEDVDRIKLHNDSEFQMRFPIGLETVSILRYVDDLLAVSSHLCGPCLQKYITTLYPWKISVSSISKHDGSPHGHNWLDYRVCFFGHKVKLMKFNQNSDWVWLNQPRERFSILPWCGRLTAHILHMRSHYINNVKVFASLHLPVRVQFLHLMTIILEFFLLGYPKKFIIGLSFCSFSSASRLVGATTRTWLNPSSLSDGL